MMFITSQNKITARSTITAVLCSFTSFAASPAISETWEMATPYAATNFHTQNIVQFIDDVALNTDGEIKINLHPGGSLIKHPEIKNAVRSGQVQIGEFALSLLSNENPIFQVDALPFLVGNYEEAAELWAVSRPATEAALAAQNIKVLYAVPWPPQGLYAQEEVTDIAQMAGQKFRAYNATTTTIATLMGAVPAQIEAPDLAQAFVTGRVESMITSPTTGVTSKAWDYVGHFHHIQGWLPKNIVVMNLDVYNGLPEETQMAIMEAAERANARGWAESEVQTNDALTTLQENGIQVHQPSDELRSQVRNIGDQIVAEWRSCAGPEGKEILMKLEE